MGAQVMARLSTLIFARHYGYEYLHLPLYALEHTPPGVAPGEWAAKWERFLNYAEGEELLGGRIAEAVAVRKVQRLRPLSGRIYSVANCHRVTNRLTTEWHALRPQLRAAYYRTSKPGLKFAGGQPILAVHVRRGDVMSHGKNSGRYTELSAVMARVDRLVSEFQCRSGHVPEVHVYSEGDVALFQPMVDRFCARLHLDEDDLTAFHGLVMADGLVMAKSSFSYLAGLISSGLCIYEPFWHPPMPDWKIWALN